MNITDNLLSSTQIQNNLGDGYLKFQLNQQTAAVLSIKHTQEVIVVPVESVTSMPNMPACILGLMNWRSRIVWVIDLSKLLNLESPKNRLRQYNMIILHTESVLLALVVPEIKGTTRLMSDAIKSPSLQVSPSLVPYLRGCVWQEPENLLVLDAQAIVQSSVLHDS
jgi:positive phototaxis protein PixI